MHLVQVTTMLSHVEEVGKAALPDPAELDTLRGNVAKQQQKVDQLSTPQPSANGVEVLSFPDILPMHHTESIYLQHAAGHINLHAAIGHRQCSNA